MTVVGLLTSWPDNAHAQYGYPAGYGGYGWGGWGSTPQGALARGLGLLQHGSRRLQRTDGRGPIDQYRHRHALEPVRLSIASDRAQQLPGHIYWPERNNINRARAEIQDRLRNHPSTRDITDGDALNVLLDISRIRRPAARRSAGSRHRSATS